MQIVRHRITETLEIGLVGLQLGGIREQALLVQISAPTLRACVSMRGI
jgi:hypothetical protein